MNFITDYKDTISFFFAFVGFVVAIRTLSFNTQQRKIENTYKTLDFMRTHITENQIAKFIELFHANNPLGVPPTEFHFPDGRKEHLDHLFSEGGSGNGDLHNIIEVLNLVSKSLNKNKLQDDLIWYEYGQIMTKCHQWTSYLVGINGPGYKHYHEVLGRVGDVSLWEKLKWKRDLRYHIDPKCSFSFHFDTYMYRRKKQKNKSPMKFYTYIE